MIFMLCWCTFMQCFFCMTTRLCIPSQLYLHRSCNSLDSSVHSTATRVLDKPFHCFSFLRYRNIIQPETLENGGQGRARVGFAWRSYFLVGGCYGGEAVLGCCSPCYSRLQIKAHLERLLLLCVLRVSGGLHHDVPASPAPQRSRPH